MIETLTAIEGSILLFIQEVLRNPVLTPLFKFVTTLGNAGIWWIVLTLLMLCAKKTRKIGCMMTVSLLGTLLINNMILKTLIGRVRPYDAIEGLIPIVARPRETSFPSGHAGSSFAAAGVLYRNLPKKWGIPALVLAILIALSRLYVGVHYPTDVLFGAVSGLAISYGAEAVVRKWSGRRPPEHDPVEQDQAGHDLAE